jgi:uncharacterized membrane protein
MKKLAGAYTFLVILGGLLTLAELILSLLNSSLCSSVGCRIVESYLRFDERYMYALGFLFFCALYVTERKEAFKKYSSLLLMFALAAEGYLVGFQFFVAHTVCPFCIALASVIICMALLKLISGVREPMLAGFCLFVLTGALVGSINIASTPIPTDRHYVLIHSKDCTHCEEVIRFSKERAIPLALIEARDVKSALGWMGIDAVPILICNDDDGKKIYSGVTTIKAVLTAKGYEPSAKETIVQSKPSRKASRPAKKKVTQNSSGTEIFHKGDDSFIYSRTDGHLGEKNGGTCSISTSSTMCE